MTTDTIRKADDNPLLPVLASPHNKLGLGTGNKTRLGKKQQGPHRNHNISALFGFGC